MAPSLLRVSPFFRHRYLGLLAIRILYQTALILALIEGVFLIEKFPTIFNAIADRGGLLSDVAFALLLTSPEIFGVALALSIMLSTYLVLLGAREDRELLALASAGVGPIHVAATLIVIGVAAQLVSLAAAASIEPFAHYAQRLVFLHAEARGVLNDQTTKQFYLFPDRIVYVDGRKDAGGRHIFIYDHMGDDERVIVASNISVVATDGLGNLALHLQNFRSFTFPESPRDAGQVTSDPSWSAPGISMTSHTREVVENFRFDDLWPLSPRGNVPEEWTLFELLDITAPPAGLSQAMLRELAKRTTHGALNLLAPFLAVLALACTNRAARLFALPIACTLMLGINLAMSVESELYSPAQSRVFVLALLLTTALAVVSIMLFMGRIFHAIVRPALARA